MLMQNSYSKFILAIITLSVDRFSKIFQDLLRQIEIKMMAGKYISCPPPVKNSPKKLESDVRFYTLVLVGVLIFNSINARATYDLLRCAYTELFDIRCLQRQRHT